MPTTSSPPTSPKTLRKRLAATLPLLLVAGAACAQAPGPFVFASQTQARAVLGARDDYVRATAALERSVKLRTAEIVGTVRFTNAMRATALGWTKEEQDALAPVLARLQRFVSAMNWRAPSPILLVKASDRLIEGLPHTRGNAIVLQEGMLQTAMGAAELLDFLLAHEAFHVLSRANPALREELYRAIGFHACGSVDMPAGLTRLRVTNPDAPESRHTITVRWIGRSTEVLPFVHFPAERIDAGAGFVGQLRTSWLPVERRDGVCVVRETADRPRLEELEGFYEQVGQNTHYVIHPEEILADNFALLFSHPQKAASPEVLERIRRILQ